MGGKFNFFVALLLGFVASLISTGGMMELKRMVYLVSELTSILTQGTSTHPTCTTSSSSSSGRGVGEEEIDLGIVADVDVDVDDVSLRSPCGSKCIMNGGRCVLGRLCLCSLGAVGKDCGTNLSEWKSFIDAAPEAAIGPDADVKGADAIERWSYMTKGPMLLRSEVAARFLASASDSGSAVHPDPASVSYRPRCSHIVEVGGLTRPLHSFLGNADVNATNLDPLSRPKLSFNRRGSAFRLSLPVTWEDYTYDGTENCFAFLGIHCDAVTRPETWDFLSLKAERVVIEMAAGEDILKCVQDQILPRVTGKGWRTVMDADIDLTKSSDAMGVNVPRWRMLRRLMMFERTAPRE